MACKYYKKGNFGVCCASDPDRVASIAEMEQYCFPDNFLECPRFGGSFFEESYHATAFSQQNRKMKTGCINQESGQKDM